MRTVTRIGIVVAIAGMAVAAYGLFSILHIESCLGHDITANADACTRHVQTQAYMLAIGLLAMTLGVTLGFAAFSWLFPLGFIVLGAAALIAGLTSGSNASSDISASVGKQIGGWFIAVGLFLLVVLAGVGRLTRAVRRSFGSGSWGTMGLGSAFTRAQSQPSAFAPVPRAAPSVVPEASGSVADRLEALAKLRDRGALTDAEFQMEKAKLLG